MNKKNLDPNSEAAIHQWVGEVDLSQQELAFKPAKFTHLKKTDWAKFYEKQQATQPLSLRLPAYFITKIKQQAVALGLPYQVLMRLWIAEKIGLA